MSTNNIPSCPTDCTSVLPSNEYNYCTPAIATGEIERAYLASADAECFTDWTSITEWTARISETSTDPDTIRRFRVVGELPEGTGDEVLISLGQKYFTEKTFVVNIETEDVSDTNYTFMRWLECQQTIKLWFEAGGKLFGGNCGLDVNVKPNYKIEKGRKTLHKIMMVFTWDSKFSPERTDSPFA